MKLLNILWIVCLAITLIIKPGYADNLQTAPGSLTPSESQPGNINGYTPPAAQSAPPLPQNMIPSYQDPNANVMINPSASRRGLEQCKVIDQNGVGMINAYAADSGPNQAGDPNAWIWVPRGMCARINSGSYNDIPQQILDKINY